MNFLLDANALIGLCFSEHIHHRSIRVWLTKNPGFAVSPVTEGALVRFIVRSYPDGPRLSRETLQVVSQLKGYEFWPDDISYVTTNLERVAGHKQVTDAYLVALAIAHGGRLATFDRALTAIHTDTDLIPFAN